MSDVINWSLAGGIVVFLMGMVSAIGSRLANKRKEKILILNRKTSTNASASDEKKIYGAAAMAAKGISNMDREENLATTGRSAR